MTCQSQQQTDPVTSHIFSWRRATLLLPKGSAQRLDLVRARVIDEVLARVGLLRAEGSWDGSRGAGWAPQGLGVGRQERSQHIWWAGGLIPGRPEAGWLADGPCPCSVGRMDTSSHLEVVWLDEPCADPQQHPASMSSPCLLAQRPPADMPSCQHARGQGTAQRQE